MYKYSLKNDSEFRELYKEYSRKSMFPKLYILLAIFTIPMLIIVSFAVKFNIKAITVALILFILSEVIGCKIYFKRTLNELLEDFTSSEKLVSFSENGVEISDDDGLVNLSWKVIDEIKAYEKYLVIYARVNGLVGKILYLKGFDVDRQVLISDIEKYKKVRWC